MLCSLPVDGGGYQLTLNAVEGGDEVLRERCVCYGCLRPANGATAELNCPVI